MTEWKISFFLFTYFLYRELHPVFNIQLIVLIQNKIDWFKTDLILFNIIIILKKKKNCRNFNSSNKNFLDVETVQPILILLKKNFDLDIEQDKV